MDIFSDPVSLMAMALAAFAGFKLWRVLGRSDAPPAERTGNLSPETTDLELKAVEVPPRMVWEGFAPKDSALANDLQGIAEKDAKFDTQNFMEQARSIHETILNAFAGGDLNKLQPLLSKSTYDLFAKEIERRKSASEIAVFKFVRLFK